MQSRDECRSSGERRRGDAETRGRAGPEEQSSEKCRAETRDQTRETRAERSRDETLSAGRDEMQSVGRDENRLETETQSESENTSNDSLKLELVRRAFLYRERNGCRGVARGERSPRARQRAYI